MTLILLRYFIWKIFLRLYSFMWYNQHCLDNNLRNHILYIYIYIYINQFNCYSDSAIYIYTENSLGEKKNVQAKKIKCFVRQPQNTLLSIWLIAQRHFSLFVTKAFANKTKFILRMIAVYWKVIIVHLNKFFSYKSFLFCLYET